MKTRALKIVVAAMLVMAMLMTAVGAATITKTKYNSGTGLLTVEYYVSGDEAVITAYDPSNESNVIYFYQQPGSGTGTFQFTVPENYEGENVAVKVGGTNEASATTVVSVTPTPAPTPDPESVEAGGIYNYVAKEPFTEDTVVVDKENRKINMDSDFDIEVNENVWDGVDKTGDCFNFDSEYMYVDPYQNIGRENITIKFAPITEGTAKISFDATLTTNGKSWENPSYFGAVFDSATYSEKSVDGKNQITGLAAGMAKVLEFNGRTILDTTATKGVVRFDNVMNASGKYTSYDVVVNDNAKHNYEYIINMDNKTYSLSVDGNLVGEYDFYDTSVEKIDSLKFYGSSYSDSNHQNSKYSVDNIVLKATENVVTHKVKFYNEKGTKVIKEVNAHANKHVASPAAPSKRDSTFVGWSLTPGGSDLTSLDEITGDINVYASYMAKPVITYMDGEDVYDVVSVDYGETIEAPVLENKGDYEFVGWYTADGKQAVFTEIKANMTVYSKFGIPNIAILEDFGTGFTLDKSKNTITTTSGLDITAAVKFYTIASKTDNMLKADGHTATNTAGGENNVVFKFPELTGGKVYISFDLAIPNAGQTNWFSYNHYPTFAIGNSETATNAAEIWMRGQTSATGEQRDVNLTMKHAGTGVQTDIIGPIREGSTLETISYVIDMDTKTYSVTWKGVTQNDIPFADTSIDSIDHFTIDLLATQHHNESNNILVDNLSIINYREILGEEAVKYEVIFYDENGTTELYRTEVVENQMPIYGGETPTKANTAQYTYTFAGWSPEIHKATAPATYKAVYSATVNKYEVTFYDENYTKLGDAQTVDYGSAATAPITPTKDADEEYTYTFKGWTELGGNGTIVDIAHITKSVHLIPAFDKIPIEPEEQFLIIPIWGDFTGDGDVTFSDIDAITTTIKGKPVTTANGYIIGRYIPETQFIWGDFTGDGDVTFSDIDAITTTIKGKPVTTVGGYIIGQEAKIPVIK